MNNNYDNITDTYQYAVTHNIDPLMPNTWDENYRNRIIKLAGITRPADTSTNELKAINESIRLYQASL